MPSPVDTLVRARAQLSHAAGRLPEDVARRLQALFDRYRQEHESSDVNSFIASLAERGLITIEQARAALGDLGAEFTLSPPTEARLPPPRKGPRYRKLAFLAKGAMGEVSITRDRDLHRNVALKVLESSIQGTPLLNRFLVEAQLTAQLDHPSIVPIYSLELGGGPPAYTMKLVRGRTLQAYLDDLRTRYKEKRRTDGEYSLPSRLELFLKVCDALAYAHARGVIHRDLKPENIMVGAFGEVLVMDWGIARFAAAVDDSFVGPKPEMDQGPGLTQVGTALGTPPYMSPEQAEGRNDELDPRSDLCALGLILFELVTLKRAYPGNTAMAVMIRAQNADKDSFVHAFGERVPRALGAIVDKATALERADRYPNVEEFAKDIRRFLRDEPPSVLPDGPVQRVVRFVGRHRSAALRLGIFLVFCLFGVIALGQVIGLGGLAISNELAARRSARLGEILATVDRRGRNIENVFEEDEALLRGIAATAEQALTHDRPDTERYLSEQFVAGDGPPDLAMSPFYKAKISTTFPDLTRAPGVDVPAVDARLRQLASLSPHFLRALAESGGPPVTKLPVADQRRRIFEQGVPAIWAYVATEEGLLAGIPGTGDYPAGYDPRTRPWYLAAKAKDGPRWGAAYVDLNGMGLLVPCSIALRDDDGRFLGIAAMDLSIAYVIDELLDLREIPGTEAWLVDPDGNVVVQSSLKARAREVNEHEPVRLPFPDVMDAWKKGRTSGHLELDGGRLAVWTRLDAIGWTYVVVGDEAVLGL